MIKKYILLGLTAIVMGAHAQDDTIRIGYCHGQADDDKRVAAEGKGWVSGAIGLTTDLLDGYAGCQVVGVNAYATSIVNVDTLQVWLRRELDGPNLATGRLTKKTTPQMKRGWNMIPLDVPFDLTTGEALFVGFSYKQRAQQYVFSVVTPPVDEPAFFWQENREAPWTDRRSEGCLSLEAVVSGNGLPAYALRIEEARSMGHTDSLTTMMVRLRNRGSQPITGLTLNTHISQLQPSVFENHFDAKLQPDADTTLFYSLPTPFVDLSARAPEVSITGVDDGPLTPVGADRLDAPFSMWRGVLVEEFTTESCHNCPRVAAYIDQLTHSPLADRVVAVARHSAYGTDQWTQPQDLSYLWFFGSGNTYAPALMIDRLAVSADDDAVPPFAPQSYDEVAAAIDFRLAMPASIALDVRALLDADTGKARLAVRGRSLDAHPADNLRLSVGIMEDSLPTLSQAGATGTFLHQHVVRWQNPAWGDAIDWQSDSTFTATYELDIDPAWETSRLRAFAYITHVNTTSPAACEVENAASASLQPADSAVQGVVYPKALQPKAPVASYTLSGIRMQQPRRSMIRKNNIWLR